MPLHPIRVVNEALEEYRQHLFTEFRARDPLLRQALEDALNEEGFLAQEPFFQAHRPFMSGERWRDLGLDARLVQVMERTTKSDRAYLHQSESIQHLLAEQAGPLAVTTGTGSGKTECFLLPVIQNAIEDASCFNRSGLTAILVYPMNALANDQEERIRELLEESGHTGIKVARYDRQTDQAERERLRRNPPHILLTNYVMLEYLLVRPSDRDELFDNHRCRFIVLDEIHTYRGSLGANIALLYRRLTSHLRHARQDWLVDNRADRNRFPSQVPVATSATIKSLDEAGRSQDEIRRLRDEAVQEFVAQITGVEPGSILVLGETLRDLDVPVEARWTPEPANVSVPDTKDTEAIRKTLAALSGLPEMASVEESVSHGAILWKLNDLLARRPMSMSGIVDKLLEEIPARNGADPHVLRGEVEAALVAGAALPDGTVGALRLRAHRFVRGGWRFHRCIDPACGRLYPMGEERCRCGVATAPLYICRSCGADVLRFSAAEPTQVPLLPNANRSNDDEWVLYDTNRFDLIGDDGEMRGRGITPGSFDPATRLFSAEAGVYPVNVTLAPARLRCLVCGGTSGNRDVLTPVSLGTSAAVRVLAEGLVETLSDENRNRPGHDGKERLLIFADSRQDAAHQARFITYAGRYDRMRRRLMEVLRREGQPLSVEQAVQALMALGVQNHDNPHTEGYDNVRYLNDSVRGRAMAWEEAPLLDDLAVTASYRATLFNLGLVGVRYQHLDTYILEDGLDVARSLGITTEQLIHLSRCLLDEIRRRNAVSRPMLRYHPGNPNCPEDFRSPADWERGIKSPVGYPLSTVNEPLTWIDETEIPDGITRSNAWRQEGRGGRSPSLQRKFEKLLERMGGVEATRDLLLDVLGLLMRGPRILIASTLHGWRQSRDLLQLNAETILLQPLADGERYRCTTCNVKMPFVREGDPCPACQGEFERWPAADYQQSRYVQRIVSDTLIPLKAGEHTAQVTGEDRKKLEDDFKAPQSQSSINVLACSPTLEMGINIGGLDAVIMRNVPPRPDNYAQRGGRVGRHSRVGVVLGYTRSTPHDAYFFDRPAEMIAGEVPAPGIGLGNRDVLLRHLHAIAFGITQPGLGGRMAEYVTLQGELQHVNITALKDGLQTVFPKVAELAFDAWGSDILDLSELGTRDELLAVLGQLPARIDDLFDRVALQIRQLEETIRRWQEMGRGDRQAVNAMELKRRLLGLPSDNRGDNRDADDRTSGNPMRRFAEFGILPGYEFPSEPCSVRLLGDTHEEDPISVERRFGIGQYQPDARAHARGHRWKVIGLDLSSPWNPNTPEPSWIYARCRLCDLRYGAQEHVRCPRCGSEDSHVPAPGHEYGGFVAKRDDSPVLEEEDRFAMASMVRCNPQWDGRIMARYELPTGWLSHLRHGEEIRWVNESRSIPNDDDPSPRLFNDVRGFYLCPACGKVLTFQPEQGEVRARGRRRARRVTGADPYGHATQCPRAGLEPVPLAIVTKNPASTLRIQVHLPDQFTEDDYKRWGHSLGNALRIGMRHLYMLDGSELEFELEPMWRSRGQDLTLRQGALLFIDAAVGGSGFLDRAARELHLVALKTLDHLDHRDCESACYRCLKSYSNQRVHEYLSWPTILPDLEHLASAPPELQPAERGDTFDPRPWNEAYEAGVGSPLELKFLRLFEQHGIDVEKQVPVAPNEGDSPISVADFAVTGTRTAIYVDGAAFHRGERLRRDRFIRRRLGAGNLGWRVVELQAADLRNPAAVILKIQ